MSGLHLLQAGFKLAQELDACHQLLVSNFEGSLMPLLLNASGRTGSGVFREDRQEMPKGCKDIGLVRYPSPRGNAYE